MPDHPATPQSVCLATCVNPAAQPGNLIASLARFLRQWRDAHNQKTPPSDMARRKRRNNNRAKKETS
jgi:hypothetical protein